MSPTPSTMLPLGTKAPDFHLPDFCGKMICLEDLNEASALLMIFMCNHCPYVKHIRVGLVELIIEYQKQGVAVIGINSNDTETCPEDRPEKMAEDAQYFGYTFPYLFDETQEVAKAYKAACTPDFFLFDIERKLVYRGQMDDSRPGNNIPVTGKDLRKAIDAVLNLGNPPEQQKPSIGCNIKWRKGNEPDYFQT